MLRAKIPKSFILCFSMVWIFACSPTDSQIKKEDTDSSHMRDCQNHYKSEGGLISSPIYETWMKYDQCDLKKGLDLALKTLQSQGHRIVSVDRVSGSIIAEMLLGKEKKKAYPTSIKIVEEKGSLFVHLRLEGAWGRSAPTDLCSFYDGFGMLLKRASLPQKSQPPSSSPSKSPREEKASPSPSVPVPTPPPSLGRHPL